MRMPLFFLFGLFFLLAPFFLAVFGGLGSGSGSGGGVGRTSGLGAGRGAGWSTAFGAPEQPRAAAATSQAGSRWRPIGGGSYQTPAGASPHAPRVEDV
jgi:hypothetical protein